MFVSKYICVLGSVACLLDTVPLSVFMSQRVMDKAYKCIAHIYLKHLVRSSQKRLAKCWSPDVGRAVAADAAVLHNTISDLVRSKFVLISDQ